MSRLLRCMFLLFGLVIIGAVVSSAALVDPASSTGEAVVTVGFLRDQVTVTADGIYDVIDLDGGVLSGAEAGHPALPVYTVFVAIPSDSHVTGLDIKSHEVLLREDILVKPVQVEHPPSLPAPPFTDPNQAVYGMDTPYPTVVAKLAGTHLMRGRKLVAILVNPVRYLPAEKKLLLNGGITLTVKYEKTISAVGVSAVVTPAPRSNALFDKMAASIVANPEDVTSADGGMMSVNEEPISTIDYLLITSTTLTNAFQALVNFRATATGGSYSTALIDLDTIYISYTGKDNQTKIRNCIKDYVYNHDTTYVCLGGDSQAVPDRNCYVAVGTKYTTGSMPTDLYYSSLDGTWDADLDNIYGEAGEDAAEMDMMPDVVVGRITTDDATPQQATDYINKLITYESNFASNNAAYGRTLLMAGKYLWNNYAGDNRPTIIMADGYSEFRDRPGYTSDSEVHCRTMYRDDIRPNWEATRLLYAFDTISTWDTSTVGDFVCSGQNLKDKLNLEAGVAYSWFWTHGSPFSMEGGSFDNAAAHSLTTLLPIFLTGACNTGWFDGTSECLSEAFIRASNGGALIYIGSSRYGWSGTSPNYARKFWDRVFEYGDKIAGDAFALHKAAYAPSCSYNGAARWLQFGLNLQGDPCVPLSGHYAKLAYDSDTIDDSIVGNSDGFINVGETVDLTVSVENSGFEIAYGVTGVLSSTYSNITVLDDTATFGTVGYPGTTTAVDPFRITITASAFIPATYTLSLVLTSADGVSTTSDVPVTVYESSIVTGTVTKVSDGTPIVGAVVTYSGPFAGELLTDASGGYSFTAVNGYYVVQASSAGYTPLPAVTITTPPGTTVNFQLGNSQIALNPASISMTVNKAEITNESFTVTNNGNVPLNVHLLRADGFTDSYNGLASYEWIDIATTGTRITDIELEDQVSGAIPLGFEFEYYGVAYSNVYVSDNGWLSFIDPSSSDPYNNTLPNTSYNPMIAFFWDDLYFMNGGRAYYETLNGDTFVLTFKDVAHQSLTGTVTLQVVLKSDGSIKCQYQNVDDASSATVGFQSADRSRGDTACYNNSASSSYIQLSDEMAIAFYPDMGTNWLYVTPEDITLEPGASTQVVVNIYTYENVGVHQAILGVVSDDQANPYIEMPISLTVVGNAINHAPVASNTTLTVLEDNEVGTNVTFSVYDADGDELDLEIVDSPTNGYFNHTGGLLSTKYCPDRNYSGVDSFTYRVNDYEEVSNIATVLVTVVNTPDRPNAYPTAPASSAQYASGAMVTFKANAYDYDGNDTIVSVIFETTNGTVIGTGAYDGNMAYEVTGTLESGTHSWRVVAIDDSGWAITSGARFISFDGNLRPVADAGTNSYVAAYQLASLDGSGSSDPDNAQNTLSFSWSQIGGPGVTLLNPTNMMASYMPESTGAHTFQLVVGDGEYFSTSSVIQTVNVLPVADDISVQTLENTTYIVIPTYNDPDGPGPYEFVAVTQPIYGSLGLCDGDSFIYIPDELAGGVIDHFDYVVRDGIGQSAVATISVLIGELNKPNVLPYRESFESFRPGFTILGRHGWNATDPEAAYISTNAAALSALAGYVGTYPISTTHDKLIAVTAAVTNEVDTSNLAGEDIVLDFMVMPSRWDLDESPSVTMNNQFGLYFNSNGTAVVWARPAPAAPAGWQILTNAAPLATNAWVRIAVEYRYSAGEKVFRVMLDGGLPVEDDAIGQVIDPDTEKCWFIMDDQSNDYMTELYISGQGYMDDVTVNLSDTNSFLGWLVEAYPGNTNYSEAADEDSDGDGHTAEQEYAAGTDPNDDTSVFEMSTIEPKAGDELVLNWSSVAGKFYAVQYGSNLLKGLSSDGGSNIVATPPMNSYTVTVGETAPCLFYRVIVE